ncbi:MAG: peptidylprolyl isomerase [Patescibacteria group bacterium]
MPDKPEEKNNTDKSPEKESKKDAKEEVQDQEIVKDDEISADKDKIRTAVLKAIEKVPDQKDPVVKHTKETGINKYFKMLIDEETPEEQDAKSIIKPKKKKKLFQNKIKKLTADLVEKSPEESEEKSSQSKPEETQDTKQKEEQEQMPEKATKTKSKEKIDFEATPESDIKEQKKEKEAVEKRVLFNAHDLLQKSVEKFKNLDTTAFSLFGLNLLITLVLVGGLILALVGFGVYQSSFLSPSTKGTVTNLIPYPAGIVNGNVLTIATLRQDVAALNRYYAVQSEDNEYFDSLPADGDIQTMVWDRFVYQTLLVELADELSLGVNEDLLSEQLDAIIEESGSYENFEDRIQYLYGWDAGTFTQKVIEPFVLQEVVAAKVFRDESLRDMRKTLANDIRVELENDPSQFEALAFEYSEDEASRLSKGDLGFFAEGTLSVDINNVLASMDSGDISDVLETGEGYEIIQLVQRLGGETGTPQLHVRRILIRYPTLELLMQEKQKNATVYRFVR